MGLGRLGSSKATTTDSLGSAASLESWFAVAQPLTYFQVRSMSFSSGQYGATHATSKVTGHRMKHRGMGWSRKGAANIMRVSLEIVAPTTS
jgi:hypothetical protein